MHRAGPSEWWCQIAENFCSSNRNYLELLRHTLYIIVISKHPFFPCEFRKVFSSFEGCRRGRGESNRVNRLLLLLLLLTRRRRYADKKTHKLGIDSFYYKKSISSSARSRRNWDSAAPPKREEYFG